VEANADCVDVAVDAVGVVDVAMVKMTIAMKKEIMKKKRMVVVVMEMVVKNTYISAFMCTYKDTYMHIYT
jgi:hypothetical protein